MDNGITFIEDDKILDFYAQLGKDIENKQSSDLRGFGTTYLTDKMEQFYEENKDDFSDSDGNPNPNSADGKPVASEYSSVLEKNKNGELELSDRTPTKGSPGIVKIDYSTDAAFHIHPNAGRRTPGGRASYGHGSSKWPDDLIKNQNKKGNYHVIVDSKYIIFYGRMNRKLNHRVNVKVSRKDLFERKP